jgi:hypothetical protein
MLEPLNTSTLPSGLRARFLDNINGLRMHVLEAGFREKDRCCTASQSSPTAGAR